MGKGRKTPDEQGAEDALNPAKSSDFITFYHVGRGWVSVVIPGELVSKVSVRLDGVFLDVVSTMTFGGIVLAYLICLLGV